MHTRLNFCRDVCHGARMNCCCKSGGLDGMQENPQLAAQSAECGAKISVPSLGHAHAKHCTRPPKRPKVAVVKWVLPRKTIKCLAQSSHVLHADETFMESSARSPRPHSARSVGSLVWHSCPDSLESCCRTSGQFKLAQYSFHQQLSMFDLVLSSKLCSA